MKKILGTIVLMFAVFSSVQAAPVLNHFIINNLGTTIGAGVTITSVQINAYSSTDESTLMTSFAGAVSITASVGDVKVVETGSNTTLAFTAGVWTGDIVLYGAGASVDVTCRDYAGTATGTASITVTEGVYAKLLVLVDGMTYAPGTASGFTGWPVTQTTYGNVDVSVTACDKYFNKASVFAGSEGQQVYVESLVSYSSSPATIDLTGSSYAVFSLTITPSPDTAGTQTIRARDTYKALATGSRNIYFRTLNDFYMWVEIDGNKPPLPAIITVPAGQAMSITVKVSHDSFGDTISGFNEPVAIKAVHYDTLLDAEDITPTNFSTANGTATVAVVYTKKERILIMPSFNSVIPSAVTHTSNSIMIDISGNSPQAFSFETDKTELVKAETADLTVEISDYFDNDVSGTAVDFAITSGSGSISTAALTDNNGRVVVVYTAPDANQDNIIAASVTINAAVVTKYVVIKSSKTTTDTKVIKNKPNPFMPGKESTSIDYFLAADSKVTLKLYNVQGQLVWSKEIVKGESGGSAGGNTVTWDGSTAKGFTVGVGVYILKVKIEGAETYTLTRKIAVKK